MDIIFQLLAMLWAKLPFIGVAVSFIFKEEIKAWWKGLRSKYINNTYAGSLHYMKSHNFGVGEYVRVDSEKARGKGAQGGWMSHYLYQFGAKGMPSLGRICAI